MFYCYGFAMVRFADYSSIIKVKKTYLMVLLWQNFFILTSHLIYLHLQYFIKIH